MKYFLLFLIIVSSRFLNAQCATTATFAVTPPTCSTCCNGSVTVTHSCATTYTWMPGALTGASLNGLCGGTTFTVYVGMASTLCCGATVGTTTVYVPTAPPCPTPINYSVNTIPESCTGCCDGTAQIIGLTGGCPAYNISWSTFPVQTGTSAIGLCSGAYSVTVTDSGCCPPNTQTLTIGSPAGGIEMNKIYSRVINVSPNPVSDKLYVSGIKRLENFEVEITNYLGQTVSKQSYANNIDVSMLTQGFYNLRIIAFNGIIFNSNFIKE